MKYPIRIIAFALVIASWGCSSTVTHETLMRRAKRMDLTSWPDTTYYCGTRNGYDYFYIWHSMPTTSDGRGRTYRVPENESPLTNRFTYTEQRFQWRLYHGFSELRPGTLGR